MDAAPAVTGGVDLVIGIGNPLRGDDGVGWWLARRARRWRCAQRPAPTVRLVPQLTPELALELATVKRVLFVDAWCAASRTAPEALLRRLDLPDADGAAGEAGAFSHAFTPSQLLALTALLEGGQPAAWTLLVPAFAFPHGPGLSAELRAVLPQARRLLEGWLSDA